MQNIDLNVIFKGTWGLRFFTAANLTHFVPPWHNPLVCKSLICGCLLFCYLSSVGKLCGQLPQSPSYLQYAEVASPLGDVIQIRGRIVEQVSQKPFELAVIMVKCGDQIVASKSTDKNGSFLLTIPSEMAFHQTFALRIKYLDHVFIQEGIRLVPQEMLIEINGTIFMENGLIDQYKLPVHALGAPKVGKVTSYQIKAVPAGVLPRS